MIDYLPKQPSFLLNGEAVNRGGARLSENRWSKTREKSNPENDHFVQLNYKLKLITHQWGDETSGDNDIPPRKMNLSRIDMRVLKEVRNCISACKRCPDIFMMDIL